MNYITSRSGLTIYLEGRIDSDNAEKVGEELMRIRKENPDGTVCLDAQSLQYISSAGLRSLLRLRKQEPDVLIVNVSPEIYEILDVTGFRRIFQVEKALRELSLAGCEEIGRSGRCTMYRLDQETITRVYDPKVPMEEIRREQKNDHTALLLGIPAAISYDLVRCGDRYGIVYEIAEAKMLSGLIRKVPEKKAEYAARYAKFVNDFNKVHADLNGAESIQFLLHERAESQQFGYTGEEVAFLHKMIDDIPEMDTLVHGELYPGNLILQDDEMLLVVMPAVITGPAAVDLALISEELRKRPEYGPEFEDTFLRCCTGIEDPAERDAYRKKLGLFYTFLLCLAAPEIRPEDPSGEVQKTVLQRALREILIPNKAALKYMLKTM